MYTAYDARMSPKSQPAVKFEPPTSGLRIAILKNNPKKIDKVVPYLNS